jgi:hypothetical protein
MKRSQDGMGKFITIINAIAGMNPITLYLVNPSKVRLRFWSKTSVSVFTTI